VVPLKANVGTLSIPTDKSPGDATLPEIKISIPAKALPSIP
jgi:hypothetical protein